MQSTATLSTQVPAVMIRGPSFVKEVTSSITPLQECIVYPHALHEAGEQAEADREWSVVLLIILADQREQAIKVRI